MDCWYSERYLRPGKGFGPDRWTIVHNSMLPWHRPAQRQTYLHETVDLCQIQRYGEGWASRLAPLLEGHPDHFKLIKSFTHFIYIGSYCIYTKSMLQYLQDALSGISCHIHLFPLYCTSRRIKIYTKFIPFCTTLNVLGKWGLLITVTPPYLTLLIKTSWSIATTLPIRLNIFNRCYDG